MLHEADRKKELRYEDLRRIDKKMDIAGVGDVPPFSVAGVGDFPLFSETSLVDPRPLLAGPKRKRCQKGDFAGSFS